MYIQKLSKVSWNISAHRYSTPLGKCVFKCWNVVSPSRKWRLHLSAARLLLHLRSSAIDRMVNGTGYTKRRLNGEIAHCKERTFTVWNMVVDNKVTRGLTLEHLSCKAAQKIRKINNCSNSELRKLQSNYMRACVGGAELAKVPFKFQVAYFP